MFYNVLGMNSAFKYWNMKCKTEDVVFEYCTECDKVTPFVKTLLCLYCGCDSPFGCFYDDDITDKQMSLYLKEHTISIGELKKLPKDVRIIFDRYY